MMLGERSQVSLLLVLLRELPHTYSYTCFYSTKQRWKQARTLPVANTGESIVLLNKYLKKTNFFILMLFFILFYCFMFFYHGKLGVMGNLVGCKHDMRMHELWDYLSENSPSMNTNAIAKLGEAKFCILFYLVPRASVLHGTKECCMRVGLLHVVPWLFPFYSLQKVSGQQILMACLKNF
jgi:hypothetical protein